MSPDSSGILVRFSGNKDKKGIWNELILAQVNLVLGICQ
jgi:hypothetical protein